MPGKPRDRDSPENGTDSFESSDSLLQSWNSQSSLLDVQRVPSFESFEDDCSQSLCLNKPTMSFKDYIQERSDPVEQGKPVIPAAVLAGFTGERIARISPSPPRAPPGRSAALFIQGVSGWSTLYSHPALPAWPSSRIGQAASLISKTASVAGIFAHPARWRGCASRGGSLTWGVQGRPAAETAGAHARGLRRP